MKRSLLIFLLSVIVISPAAASAAPVEINNSPALKPAVTSDLDISIRLIGGRGAVLMPGRDINLTFQTSSDAYVIVYNIDSEGYVHLLYPADGRPEIIRGRKVHFLPEQGKGTTWEAGGDTGIEYIHAIAIDDPSRIDRDELYYLAQNSEMPEDQRLRIDMDPFLAFNMIDEELIDDAERMAPATDYTYFYVNHEVDYPGYLCYKCHSPSKIPDPYGMECPEVDIEMIAANEDAGYPYPQLFAVIQADEAGPEDEYDSYTYYADNLSLGYGDYDYDQQKVYLSVYNSYDWYPYYCSWPGYWSWYVNWSPSWYWDISYGMGWGWSGYYYHHWPFYSWYPYSYHSYWRGYHHGYWDGYYADGGWGGGYYASPYHAPVNRRSLYAGRGFTKRGSLDYASTRVKKSRESTLSSSRLVRERTKTAMARSYQRSRLAKQVTRERASTGFRSFESNRYNTGRSGRYKSDVYGNYGTTRSARITNQSEKRSTRMKRRNSEGTLKSDRGNRDFYRRSTRSTTGRSSGSDNKGSKIERRVRSSRSGEDTKAHDSGIRRKSSGSNARKSTTRSGKSARSTKDSNKGDSDKSNSSSTRKSSSRDSGARKETRSNSPTRSSTGRSTTRSGSTRSSGGRSSGRSSSGGKSSSGRKR